MAPPRKRAKLASRVNTPKEKTPVAATKLSQEPESPSPKELALEPDPWTDDQEAALFKSIVRYKPAGLHRHIRMYCILTSLRRHGWTDDHISRSGVWKKLDRLYNMEALHEREDADELERADEWTEFWLPTADFGDDMFARRISAKRSSSPPTLNHQLVRRDRSNTRRKESVSTRKSISGPAAAATPERALRGSISRSERGPKAPSAASSSRRRTRTETTVSEEEEEAAAVAEDSQGGEDQEQEDGDENTDEDGDEESGSEEKGSGDDEGTGEEAEEEEGDSDGGDSDGEDEADAASSDEAAAEPKTSKEPPSRRASRGGRGARASRGVGRQRSTAASTRGDHGGGGSRGGRGGKRGKATRGGRGGRGRGSRG